MYDGKGQPGAGTTLSNGSVVANVRRRHCRRPFGRSSGAVSTLHTLVHRYQRHTHRRYRGCRPSLRCAAPAPARAPMARAPTARQLLRRLPLRPLPQPPPRRPRCGAHPRHERRASSRHQAPSGQRWREGRPLLLVPRPSELRAQQIEERRLEPALRPSPRQARRTSDEAVYRGALCHGWVRCRAGVRQAAEASTQRMCFRAHVSRLFALNIKSDEIHFTRLSRRDETAARPARSGPSPQPSARAPRRGAPRRPGPLTTTDEAAR